MKAAGENNQTPLFLKILTKKTRANFTKFPETI